MTRLAFGGFDGAHEHADGLIAAASNTNWTPAYDSVTTRLGHGFSARAHTPAVADTGISYLRDIFTGSTGVTFFGRVWFLVSAYPPTNVPIAVGGDASNVLVKAVLRTDGVIELQRGTGAVIATTAAVALSTWHCVELSMVAYGVAGTGAGQGIWVAGRLNGTTLSVPVNSNNSSALVTEFRCGIAQTTAFSTSWSIWLEDWARNDDTGTADNSWPGITEQITLLLPATDSAVSANWVLGDFSAAGGLAHNSVDNTPPTGKSGPAAGDQIRNSVNDITSPNADADFAMQTYTTGGVGATDTVSYVFALCEAAPGTAAAQSVGVAGVSNPAITAVAANTGASAVGTYPANWTRIATAILAPASAPTYGTAPVVRVGRRTATVDTLNVCLVALYVAYSPGVAAPTTRFMCTA